MKNFWFTQCFALLFFVNQTLSSEVGMPQLNTEFWASQIFWLVIIFSILYLIIWKIFLPKITFSIENRKSRLVNDLNEAEKLKESAEKKLKEYNKIIEDSKKDAKKLVDDNRKKLDKDIESKKQKFSAEIEKELINAEKEINDFKKSSLSNINKISVEITSEVINQIIKTEVNKSSVSAIVNEVIKRKTGKHI